MESAHGRMMRALRGQSEPQSLGTRSPPPGLRVTAAAARPLRARRSVPAALRSPLLGQPPGSAAQRHNSGSRKAARGRRPPIAAAAAAAATAAAAPGPPGGAGQRRARPGPRPHSAARRLRCGPAPPLQHDVTDRGCGSGGPGCGREAGGGRGCFTALPPRGGGAGVGTGPSGLLLR